MNLKQKECLFAIIYMKRSFLISFVDPKHSRVVDSGSECEIGEPSPNSNRVDWKIMNPSLMGKIAADRTSVNSNQPVES